MKFIALKEDYSISNILNPINVQWNRQYYECGTFNIQIPASQYSNDMMYIYTKAREELGQIDKVGYSIEKNGFRSVQLSGYFIENELNDKVVYPQFSANGNIEDEATRMVNAYKKDIPLITVAKSQSRGNSTVFTSNDGELATELYTALQQHEMSFSVKYDYVSNTKAFSIWQGLDRTQSQNINDPITFSTAFKNLINPNVVIKKNFKNYAIVKGSYDGADVRVVADISNGGYQKQTFIDGSSVEVEEGMTLAQYKALLVQYGVNTLITDYVSINNILYDVDPMSYEYMKDYDLGDKCTVIIEDIGLVLEARIISIYEVFKDNTQAISLELGNQRIK